jgi:tetratricopeptide (TPR) repeat protein
MTLLGSRMPASELLTAAEKIQTESGDKKAIEYMWKNSEKMDRPELLYLAKLLVKQRNYKDILKVSELALAKKSEDAEFLTFQGKAYLESFKDKKNLDKAQESLRAAIAANPKFEPAYLILDDYYDRQDQISRNLKKPLRFLQSRRQLFEDLIAQRGEQPLYYSKLCEFDTIDGLNAQAIQNCKKATDLDKNDVKSYLHLAQVYKQSGDEALALTTLKSTLESHKTSEEVQFTIGQFYENQKNYIESYTHYKLCDTDRCLRGLGSSSAQLKKWQESFDTFQKLCKKNRKWSGDVRKASQIAKELGAMEWEQRLLELSLNCNI